MKTTIATITLLGTLLGGAATSLAALSQWQSEVALGTSPAATYFSTVSGASPIRLDVGTLSGDRSFEFIYNSTSGGPSQAFMGSQAASSGQQGLKLDQWNATGFFGLTDFGVADYTSSVSYPQGADTHVVYSSNGSDTLLYVNGTLAYTFTGVDLTATGINGLAAASNAANSSFFDNMNGSILGFASYDSALSPAEVQTHAAAFAIPEPGAAALGLMAGLVAAVRRRR
ncbi:MAG: hypothetical protein KA004_12510 [Verrucomicrobiales bacterium]|nr:hypothetical protein [Verrucomicrobiales bacterium]